MSEEKSVSNFPFSLLSILVGFFVFISLCISFYFIESLAGTLGVTADNEVILYYLLFCLFVGVLSILGIVMGIIGVMKKTVWSWIGIIINLLILCITPIIWLLMLTVFATAY